MKYSYNWLKWYVPDAPPAEKLADIFTYHLAEVENIEKLPDGNTVFEIKILPNRAHDLLSHMGLARELASLINIAYVDPTPKYKVPPLRQGAAEQALKINIETDNCRRYMGRIIRNVKVGPSPDWVVKHLESIGQRSINNMVDATNLVMYDCGQPTHVFDLTKIKEKIVIRQAKEGETLTTLDNRECKFKDSDMIIADAERPLAIAGVKGGKLAEVDENTTEIILEVANFDPTSVRKTAQALNLFTDARKRFENDLSSTLGDYAMRELSALIAEMCPEAEFEDVVDEYPIKQKEQKMSFRADKVRNVLGFDVSNAEIEDILKRYNFTFTANEGIYEITVPPLRLDLTLEEDVAEEIGRVLGYDKVPALLPTTNFQPKQNLAYAKIVWARNKLIAEGYSEVMTSSFKNRGKLAVMASASDKNFLRNDLKDGLLESIKLNQSNAPFLGIDKANIFEIGTVWTPQEEMRVAWGDKKEIHEQTLEEFCKDADLSKISVMSSRSSATFKMWSLYPFIARDIAVWVPAGVESNQVQKVIKDNVGELVVKGPDLFDQFEKEGRVSYAFRIVFQSYERTLTDGEVNEVMQNISLKFKANGWEVR